MPKRKTDRIAIKMEFDISYQYPEHRDEMITDLLNGHGFHGLAGAGIASRGRSGSYRIEPVKDSIKLGHRDFRSCFESCQESIPGRRDS